MAQDYRKRFQAAIALLTEMYAADVAAVVGPMSFSKDEGERGNSKRRKAGRGAGDDEELRRRKSRGFELYDKALVSLLTKLSMSLEAPQRQKLFTQTLLECPRVPVAALELVCNLCDMASNPHDVQTGEMAGMQHNTCPE